MNTLKTLSSAGVLPAPPLPLPLKTCLFFEYKGEMQSSWTFLSRNVNNAYRMACLRSIAAGGGNSVIALLSGLPDVNLWEDAWGGTVDMGQLTLLETCARYISSFGAAFWPCFFCDEDTNAPVRNASNAAHERAFSLLIAHLRPYVPGFIIGLESSEYFDCARHNYFVELIRKFAPDRYVVSHMQKIPKGGMPAIDAWFYEHPWNPWTGDEHNPAEVVEEARKAQAYGKFVWPVEYNVKATGSIIREQSRALLAAGFGCGGPV